jgi:hypothetical protein
VEKSFAPPAGLLAMCLAPGFSQVHDRFFQACSISKIVGFFPVSKQTPFSRGLLKSKPTANGQRKLSRDMGTIRAKFSCNPWTNMGFEFIQEALRNHTK